MKKHPAMNPVDMARARINASLASWRLYSDINGVSISILFDLREFSISESVKYICFDLFSVNQECFYAF